MRIVPVHLWNPSADNRDGLLVRSKHPVLAKVMEERRRRSRRPKDQESYLLDRIALESRVIVVEGIAGSGKDMFETYLKEKLKGRVVYDYSEGEVLNSWKQLQIEGIFELRIKFMKLFVNYIKNVLSRDENAVFLLNRFHLSAYVFTIIQQPKLEIEYDEIINVLRTLPVHVFMLQLDKNEIEGRSLHPERSGAWQKFQHQIVKRDGFRGRLERYVRQQRLMLEKAETQEIPYSVIRLTDESEVGDGQVRISKAPSIVSRGVRMNATDVRISRRKRGIPQTVKETV
jgi:thymidylate kinase